jgi:hypothetical protein
MTSPQDATRKARSSHPVWGLRVSAETLAPRRFRGNVSSTPGVLEQDINGQSVVHRLSTPASDGRVLINVDALLCVCRRQVLPVGRGAGVIRGDTVERASIGSDKAQCAVIESLRHDSAFMHLTAMKAAQLNQIAQLSLPSLAPVMGVVCIPVACVRAPREAAAVIARIQRAT